MDLRYRLLIKKTPFAHEAGTRVLDLINKAYYLNADRHMHFTDQMKSLRGKHLGERCFVIGNGPSLRTEDLDMISGEYSFASNAIFECYDSTKWRPSYYVTQDVYDERLRDYVESSPTERTFVGAYFHRKHKIRNKDVVCFLGKKAHRSAGFSDDCSKSVCEMATVTYSMLQLAIFFGFESIYLIGIDNTYRNTIDERNEVVTANGVEDHFYPSSSHHTSYANIGQMNRAYELAKIAAAHRGVEIVNVTRGGALEVFPRMSLEQVLSSRRV